MTTANDESRLLALPIELLQRITNSLNDESLPTLRLTCKTLENATLDQFAAAFLQKRNYFIHDEKRWLLLKNLLSTRMASRMHEITFTCCALEEKPFWNIPLAPEKDDEEEECQSLDEAQRLFYSWHTYLPGEFLRSVTRPGRALMHRVMVDIKKFAPNAQVHFSSWQRGRRIPGIGNASYADVIFATATTGLALKTLKVSEPGTSVFRDLVDHLEPELVACISSLTDFSYDMGSGGFEDDAFATDAELVASAGAIQKVLNHINCLRELDLFLIRESWDPTPAKLILANNFAHLETLRLSQVVCYERDLMVLLSGCRLTLRLLCLSKTHLLGCKNNDAPWLDVFKMMSSMTSLNHVCVGSVYAGDLEVAKTLNLGSPRNVVSDNGLILFRGHEEVAASFKELLSSPLSYKPW